MHLASGTVIKLYDYQVGARFLSFRGAREALNENLVETILPFRLLDFRQTPDKKRGGDRAEGIDPRPFYGMEFLLLNSHREDKSPDSDDVSDDEDGDDADNEPAAEQRISVGAIQHPELGEINVTAIALKRKLPRWLINTNNRVFHSVNGQVQWKQTRGYLSDCGFPALKDRIVIVVDASQLSFKAHNDVWKGDREHIRNTLSGELYREQVTTTIKESPVLKAIQTKIATEELDRATKQEGNDLFQKLVDADPNLAGLLSNKDPVIRLPSGGGTKGDSPGTGEFKDGKYSPTFLNLDDKFKKSGIEIPINRTRVVTGRTDAVNDYFRRADNRGRLILSSEAAAKFAFRKHLLNGRLTIFITCVENAIEVGDVVPVMIELQDPSMPAPVGDQFIIRVTEEEKVEKKQPKPPKPKPTPKAGSKGDKPGGDEKAPTHGLPPYRLLTKQGREIAGEETMAWPEGFTETDGGYAQDLGDGNTIYYVNYDNSYHLKYRMQQKGDLARDAVTSKYILGMRILMLGYEHALNAITGDNEAGIREHFDRFRRMAAKAASTTVLALADYLPRIVANVPQEAE